MIKIFKPAILVVFLVPIRLGADGGTLQFRKQAGPYSVALFSAPVPLRAGACDLSVMVQKNSDGSPVLDANVAIVAEKPGEAQIQVRATREQATNKLLYAAKLELRSSGDWNVRIDVDDLAVSGNVQVFGALPTALENWPLFAVVPIAIVLFFLNQWLKGKRRLNRFEARP